MSSHHWELLKRQQLAGNAVIASGAIHELHRKEGLLVAFTDFMDRANIGLVLDSYQHWPGDTYSSVKRAVPPTRRLAERGHQVVPCIVLVLLAFETVVLFLAEEWRNRISQLQFTFNKMQKPASLRSED